MGNLRERDYFRDLGIDGRIIIRWISGSEMRVYGLDQAGSG